MQLFKAISAQVLGLLLAATLLHFARITGLWPLLAVQAVAAAICSRGLRQPGWWIPIHLLFLPVAMAMTQLGVPPWLYLLTALLLLLVFWGTIKGDVPLFLSSHAVTEALHELIIDEQAPRVVDLGAGIGSVAVPLARQLPEVQVDAWENAPIPWLIAAWRGRQLENLHVVRSSLWQCELASYAVVFAFLSPVAMPRLGDKVRREMRPGSLFISSSFPVPEWAPEKVIQLTDPMQTRLYCYRIP